MPRKLSKAEEAARARVKLELQCVQAGVMRLIFVKGFWVITTNGPKLIKQPKVLCCYGVN